MHRKLSLTNDADKFLDRLDAKQFKQVVRRILALAHDPIPTDSIQMKGRRYRRVDQGEYRIVYFSDEDTVTIVVVGKRNDDDVYLSAKQK
jgi:mRNA interferase RelE/StbE